MTFVKTVSASLFAATLLAVAGSASAAPPQVVPDRLLAQLPGLDDQNAVLEAIAALSDEVGVELRFKRASILDWYVLEVVSEERMEQAQLEPIVTRLREQRSVSRIDLDRIVQPFATFNDPGLGQQHSVDLLGLQNAWDISVGDPGLVVAVVDSGIVAHEDLQGAVLGGYDFISDPFGANDGDGRDADPFDDGGTTMDCGGYAGSSGFHGTMVSGVVAARAGNGLGVAGAAPRVSLTAIRALGACGGTNLDIAEATWWAAGGEIDGVPNNPNPAAVINLSLGGPGACAPLTQDVFNALDEAGIISVVAAGNEGQDTANVSPANCNGVLTVAATDFEGFVTAYSNYGDEVDVLAPGGDFTQGEEGGVLTTVGPNSDDYTFTQGTSFAAPYIAGIAALMLSVEPNLDRAAIVQTLAATGNTGQCFNANLQDFVGCDRPLADAGGAIAATAQGNPPAPPADTMTCGTSATGNSGEGATVALSVAQDRDIVLKLTWNNGADLDLYLLDASGDETLSSSEAVDTTFESIEGGLPAGDYIVFVNPYEGSADFTLTFDCDGVNAGGGNGNGNGGNSSRGPAGCSLSSGADGGSVTPLAMLLLAGLTLRRRAS
jgi:serine protease